jgi:hypothetical protein
MIESFSFYFWKFKGTNLFEADTVAKECFFVLAQKKKDSDFKKYINHFTENLVKKIDS